MTLPTSLVAGDTAAWTESLADYSAAAGWTLHYRIVNGASTHTFDASASGSSFAVSLTAATTSKWAPGTYQLVGWVTKASERYTVSNTQLTVKPDLAAAKAYDGRSSAAIALAAVEDALKAYGAKAWMQSYAVGDRTQTFRSPGEFMSFRSKLKAEVEREQAAQRAEAGLQPKKRLLVRLGPTR